MIYEKLHYQFVEHNKTFFVVLEIPKLGEESFEGKINKIIDNSTRDKLYFLGFFTKTC